MDINFKRMNEFMGIVNGFDTKWTKKNIIINKIVKNLIFSRT